MYPAQVERNSAEGPLGALGQAFQPQEPTLPLLSAPRPAAASTNWCEAPSVPGTALITPHHYLPLPSLPLSQAHLPVEGVQVRR